MKHRITVSPRAAELEDLAKSKDVAIYCVVRVADRPAETIHPALRRRNQRATCDNCGEQCWYDPVHAIPGLRILCTHCLPPEFDVHLTSEQIAEMRKTFGSGTT